MYTSRLLALVVHGCAKLSVCLLIRQISNGGLLNVVNWILGAIIILWVVSGFAATAFQCPLPEPWLAVSSGACPGLEPIYMHNGIMNILTDVALCLLPVAMMWEVQTTVQRKLIVITLFSCRIV
jgi:hypothetical protein